VSQEDYGTELLKELGTEIIDQEIDFSIREEVLISPDNEIYEALKKLKKLLERKTKKDIK